MKKVPVVILPVGVTGQSEQARNRHDKDCRTVERIDISVKRSDRICDEGPAPKRNNYYERPQSPVRLDELMWEKVPRDGFLQISANPRQRKKSARQLLCIVVRAFKMSFRTRVFEIAILWALIVS